MRVLHVFGGIRAFKITSWLYSKGVKVGNIVIENAKPFESYYANTDISIYKNNFLTKAYEHTKKIRFLSSRIYVVLYPLYLNLLCSSIKRFKPDIVHAHRHIGAYLTIIAKKMCGLKNLKVVFDYQDPWSGEQLKQKSFLHKGLVDFFYAFEKYVIKNSDFVITQGEEQTDLIVKRYGINKNRISDTLNAVDESVFKMYKNEREKLRKEYGLNNKTAILFLGSLVDYYGVDMIPKAARDVLKDFPNVKFVIMGIIRDKNLWGAIRAEIRSYNIQDNFVEIYPKKKSDIPKLVSACDIGLVLHKKGNIISEIGVPTKMFEYMGCGLAVISSNMNHLAKYILPEKAGIVFEPNSVQSLAVAIKQLLKNPSKIKVMGKNGRVAVERKYNWGNEMEKLLRGYKFLLNN